MGRKWAFTVTVRRRFFKDLLRFMADTPSYQHLPADETRALRVYGPPRSANLLVEWFSELKEPFDLVRATGQVQYARLDEEGLWVIRWFDRYLTAQKYSPQSPYEFIPAWENQDYRKKLNQMNQLMDS